MQMYVIRFFFVFLQPEIIVIRFFFVFLQPEIIYDLIV